MMKIGNILILSLLLFVACSDKDTDLVLEQRESIVKFLTTKHSPVLISERETAESLYDEPEFYTVINNTAYRYIKDYYNPDRATYAEVKREDTLSLTFWCYDFSSFSMPKDAYLYYTNDPNYEEVLNQAGLNTEYWSFEPKKIVLGQGDILKAIETALVGCREGDSVEIYLTYNVAYGNSWIGLTNLESPIAFFCTIESIEN